MDLASTAVPPPPAGRPAAAPPIPPPPRPDGVGDMSGPALVAVAVECQVAENASRARRLAAIGEFHRREVATGGLPCPANPAVFILTPMQSTTAEFSGVLAVSDMSIEIQVNIEHRLSTHFPKVWAMCLAGRMDLGRAQILPDAAASLAHEADIARFAAAMDEYIAKFDDPTNPICPLDYGKLLRAARYRKMKYEQRTEEESFAAAFKRRRLSFRPGDDGIGSLAVRTRVTDLMTADYRVTLIAKRLQQVPDETRTLEQIRTDVAVALLLGTLEVDATLAELDEDGPHDDPDDPEGGPGDPDGEPGDPDGEPGDPAGGRDPLEFFKYPELGRYARPIINVTVPIQTLLGLSEEPGLLSGGIPIPPELARVIGADPTSTWYRMLTDEARRCVELSTTSYSPTPPIWRQTTATHPTCLWPTCSRPAVRCECDHRVEFPEGRTCTSNLGPACKRHHKVKHSDGFTLTKNDDGSYTWTTRTGSTITHRPEEQPVADWPDAKTVAYEEMNTTLNVNLAS